MELAIIGVGNVGGSLAAAAVGAGHDVVVSAADPAGAQERAAATGATAAAGNLERTLEELALLDSSLDATRGWTWQSAFQLVGPQTPVAA